MTDIIEAEQAALRRIAHPRLHNSAVAKMRVRIKRKLRLAGAQVPHDASTAELASWLKNIHELQGRN